MPFSLTYRLRIYVSILIIVIIIGILGLVAIEGMSLFDSFYFIIVTVATVGYGDITPLTPAGKLLVIGIILTGVGCFVGVVANTIESMIEDRERLQRLQKLNMIIGVFYSEVGTKLLKKFSMHDANIREIQSALVVSDNWADQDFSNAEKILLRHDYCLDSRMINLEEIHGFLTHHKGFLLALLENPQLIEHDSFTPLLQAVFHLTEELISRERLTGLPPADYAHLSGDLNRVYSLLTGEWLTYMRHLKKNYPYLFSLAMRTNPFDSHAEVIIQ
jgi:hypothetical protein